MHDACDLQWQNIVIRWFMPYVTFKKFCHKGVSDLTTLRLAWLHEHVTEFCIMLSQYCHELLFPSITTQAVVGFYQ